jgi:hypothetical protein
MLHPSALEPASSSWDRDGPADRGVTRWRPVGAIDVNWLHREGCLFAGWTGGWQWTRDGEKVASINLRT